MEKVAIAVRGAGLREQRSLEQEMEGVGRVFKALSDPLRLELLRILPREADRNGICVCDLAHRLGVSQPNVSHHLGILREAGLVRVERCGGFSYYYVELATARCALSQLERALS